MPLPKKTKRRSGIPVHTGTRQTRLKARPAPDFTKLHNQWSEQCKQRKASKKPCTQIQEFHFATPGQRTEHKTEEKPEPHTITRHMSLKRHHPSCQGQPQCPRSDSSSSQPDEVFVAENESLQSILSNTGITVSTAASATERQTLAVAPTFKTPFVVNEPRQSVYYTGQRKGKRLSNMFSECKKPATSRLHPETTGAAKASVSSPFMRGPIEVLQRQSIYRTYYYPEPPGGTVKSQDVPRTLPRRGPIEVLQRQSIYRTYYYPEPPGGTVKSQDVPRTLPRARRVPVVSASSPALRQLSKSSSKKKVRWNDLARQNRLTPNSKKDAVVTMLTFNDDQATGESATAQQDNQAVVDHKNEKLSDNDHDKKSHSVTGAQTDEIHQMEPLVGSLKDDATPRKTQLRLQNGSSSESRRNRPVPKHFFPNVLADVSNSPEGRLSSPGGIASKLSSWQSEHFGAIKHEFVVLDDSGSKIYHARAVPETASDKENVSPYLLTFHQHGRLPVCSDLEQDLSESMLEFDRLEGQVRKLRRRSEAVVAGNDDTAKRNIMEQLAMIKRKQEDLIRLQAVLQTQLSKQVCESGSWTSTHSPALVSGTALAAATSLHCHQEGGIVSPKHQQRSCSEDDGLACGHSTEHMTELMRTVQLRTEDPVPTSGTPPDNRTGAPVIPQSPVLIVTDHDGECEVVTPPTIQQMELLGIPLVTPGIGHSLLPFPQSPVRNSHYSPFLTRISGSDGSVLYTPSTPGSYQGADYYDQAVFSPKSRMAGSAQILSPIKDSFPIQLPVAVFTPSPVKLSRRMASEMDRMLPVANLSRKLHDFDGNMSPLPRVKRHSPLPRVVVPTVGALSLAGNLAPHHRQNTRHQGAKASVRDRILGSAAHRYCEALLDEEVALFACRLHVTLGLAPLLISRCSDPVASVLDQGDDRHFVPICDSPSRSPPFSSAFSAFSDFTQ